MNILLEQEISSHPLFENIKRKVVVYGANIDGKFNQIVMDAEVRYFDSNNADKDVTAGFNSDLKGWIVNNQDFTTVRDEKGFPVPNSTYQEPPETEEQEDLRTPNQQEKYLKVPSFDYFFGIIKDPTAPSLIKLLQMHILQNDSIQFFDELLKLNK